jgi:hypothetical protein
MYHIDTYFRVMDQRLQDTETPDYESALDLDEVERIAFHEDRYRTRTLTLRRKQSHQRGRALESAGTALK